MHAWLGGLLLVPLIFVAVSGAGLSFAREIDRVFAPELWTVSPPRDAVPVTAKTLAAVVERHRPADRLVRLEMPRQPQDAALAILAGADGTRWQVFLDPYRQTPTGSRPLNDDPRVWLGEWHRSLTLGPVGQGVVLLSCVGLVALFVSGRFARSARKRGGLASGHRRLVATAAWLWLTCGATGLIAAGIGSSLDASTPPVAASVLLADWERETVCNGQQVDMAWWRESGEVTLRCRGSGSIGPFGLTYHGPSGETVGPSWADWLSAAHAGSLFGIGGQVLWFWGTLLLPATMLVGLAALWRRRAATAPRHEDRSATSMENVRE